MKSTTLFENNRTQAVRLPTEVRFPSHVKKVIVRVMGKDRVISPLDASWDSFFDSIETVPEDFLPTRPSQPDSPREPL
jgi:antitoxin VapB